MNVKTAFRKAVEAYPERERRVALATFAIRYSRGWHLSDYRCVGLDADVIKLFLKECGFGPDAVEDAVTQRDPDSHLLQWPDHHIMIGKLAAELQETLSTEARRIELYAAQLDHTPDPAPNLKDGAPVGEDAPVWDPLGLYPATLALATRLHENRTGADPESVQWAEAWLARGKAARTVMAPMWVLERAMPGSLGLLSATWRSSSGQTSAIPFSFGRYVRRDEPLSPPFPVIASMPVANVWGVSSRHGQTPLDGYVAVTFGDLMDVEPDAPGTPAAKRRDMWMHVESAYVTVDSVGSMKQMELLTRPKLLWRYVCSMFEATYGHRTVLVPDQCLVHSGQAECDLETVSTLDKAVADGQRLEIRAALIIAGEEPAVSSKPCGADCVAAGAPNLVVLPGDPRPGADPYVRDDGRFDLTGTLALEWYLMTHMLSGAPLRPPAARSQGGDPHVTEAIRRWAAETERVPGEAQLPDETAVRYDFRYGYNAGTHIACSILDNMRNSMDLKEFNAIGPADWQGANKELHGVQKPVVAVYSCVLGDGCPIPDLTKGATPAAVTKALDTIADPAVQLAVPTDPKAVMVVVETQIKYPKGRLPSTVGPFTRSQYLRDLFLWGLMVNQCKHLNYTLCLRNSDEPTQRLIRDELQQLGVPQYHFLWADGPDAATRLPAMHDDGDYDALAGCAGDDTEVEMLKDSHDRLVLAFKVEALSPVECACRAAFRYYTNAPVLGNEAMARVFATQADKYIVLDPDAPNFARVVRAHIKSGSCGVVPGWTSIASPYWNKYMRSSVPPIAEMYTYADKIKAHTGSAIMKALS